jgi:beta-N-acetylhexosaminidase
VIKNFCDSKVLLACYEDDDATQQVASDMVFGRLQARGILPVTVCESFNTAMASLPNVYCPGARC